jgi:hypothetical protein
MLARLQSCRGERTLHLGDAWQPRIVQLACPREITVVQDRVQPPAERTPDEGVAGDVPS